MSGDRYGTIRDILNEYLGTANTPEARRELLEKLFVYDYVVMCKDTPDPPEEET